MNNLAIVLEEQGKVKEAEQMHRRTLLLKEKVLGKEHPNTLMSMSNLAVALNGQGNHAEADAIYRGTLSTREKVLGKEHPETLRSMNQVAMVLTRQKKFREAEELYRETLALREMVLGPEHPDTLTSVQGIGFVLQQQGDYKIPYYLTNKLTRALQRLSGQIIQRRRNALTGTILSRIWLREGYPMRATYHFQRTLKETRTIPLIQINMGCHLTPTTIHVPRKRRTDCDQVRGNTYHLNASSEAWKLPCTLGTQILRFVPRSPLLAMRGTEASTQYSLGGAPETLRH
jgi:hypothetical protein